MQAAFAIKIWSPTTDVGRQFRGGAIRKHPQDVGPQSAIARRMRIAILVAECMMLAMIRHPEERRTLARHAAQPCKEHPDGLRRGKTAVREQPVVAHADAKTSRHVIQRQADRQARPREAEWCRQGRQMHAHDPDQHRPIEPAHSPDAILSRLHGEIMRARLVTLPGVVHGRPPKVTLVRSCISHGCGIEIRLDTRMGNARMFSPLGCFVVNALPVASGS